MKIKIKERNEKKMRSFPPNNMRHARKKEQKKEQELSQEQKCTTDINVLNSFYNDRARQHFVG